MNNITPVHHDGEGRIRSAGLDNRTVCIIHHAGGLLNSEQQHQLAEFIVIAVNSKGAA